MSHRSHLFLSQHEVMRYLYIINPISLDIDFESEINFKKHWLLLSLPPPPMMLLRIYLSRDKFKISARMKINKFKNCARKSTHKKHE